VTGPVLRGTGFGRLWAANAVSNVGDGITLAAGPLLVASLTDSPALISLAVRCRAGSWPRRSGSRHRSGSRSR
jgi:hypothetical protein